MAVSSRPSRRRSTRCSSIDDAIEETPPEVRLRHAAQDQEAYELLGRQQPTPIENNSSDDETPFDAAATKRQLLDAIDEQIFPGMDSKEYHSIVKFKFLRFAPLGENNAVDDEKRWIYRRALKYAQDRYKGRTNLDPNKEPNDRGQDQDEVFFGLYKNSQVDYSTEKVDSDKGTSDLLFSSEIDEEGSNRVELLSL